MHYDPDPNKKAAKVKITSRSVPMRPAAKPALPVCTPGYDYDGVPYDGVPTVPTQEGAAKAIPEPPTLTDTLTERGKKYGKFTSHAKLTQSIKDVMHQTVNWYELGSDQREALEMIAHKVGRILNGDPDYDDSWVDIAGYAQLVADRLRGGAR